VVDDLENPFPSIGDRSIRQQKPSDPEMCRGALAFRDERVGRFLHAVMREPVLPLERDEQTSLSSDTEGGAWIALDGARQRGDIKLATETRADAEGNLALGG
jgi:hypothetical protein